MLKVTFRFLDKDFELITNSQRLFNYLIKYYCLFVVEEGEEGYTPNKIEMIVEPPDSKRIGKFLIEFFSRIQSLLCSDYIMLHGAAIARNDKAKVFLGPPNSGKTTISLFAAQKSYQLLSDEICLVNKKNLTIAPFQRGSTNINPYTVRFLKEHRLSLDSKMRIKSKKRIYLNKDKELGIKNLIRMGIDFAKKEYPIEKIYLFHKDRTPLLPVLISLCYQQKFQKPPMLIIGLRFLYYLLNKYPYQTISPFNLSTAEQRRLSYKRIMKLLDLA